MSDILQPHCVVSGIVTGFGGGLVGVAGASLTITLLIFVIDMPQRVAQGTVGRETP